MCLRLLYSFKNKINSFLIQTHKAPAHGHVRLLRLVPISLSALLFAAFVSTALHAQHKTVPEMLAYFQDYVKKARKEWNAPGVSVAIVEGDHVYFINDGEQTLGGPKVTEHSIYCVMSCSKIITSIVLHQLVDEGRLSLDDKVVDHLPWFQLSDPQKTQQVRVRHLVSHNIGLPGFSADTLWDLDFSQKEILSNLKKLPMPYAPGKKYGYQNIMVGIAGLLIEKITGKPLKDVVQERVFSRLEMKSASMGKHPTGVFRLMRQWFSKDPRHQNIVTGYQCVNHQHVVARTDDAYLFPGTSGVNASTADYVALLRMLVNRGRIVYGLHKGERLFSEKAWGIMSSPQIKIEHVSPSNIQFPVKRIQDFYYGNGMYGMKYGKSQNYINILLHMGSGNGFRSFWAVVPDANIGIVVFSNYGSLNISILPEVIVYKFFDMYFNISNYDWSAQQKKLQKFYQDPGDNFSYIAAQVIDLNAVAGTYEHPLYGRAQVEVRNGKLLTRLRNKHVFLTPTGGPCFTFNPHDLSKRWGDGERGLVIFNVSEKTLRFTNLHEGNGKFTKIS